MKLTARDIMTRTVYAIRDDRSVEELAAFLVEREISGAPVVNRDGKLVGVVTAKDIVEDRNEGGEAPPSASRVQDWEGTMNADELNRLSIQAEGRLVRDIMTPAVYSVPEDLTIKEVAKTMVAGRVHRLFVTRGGEIVGLISALDLLKLLYEEPAVAQQEVLVAG